MAVRKNKIAASAELHDKASAGTLLVPSCLVEANIDEHEGSDDELSKVSKGSDLSDHEATYLNTSVCSSKDLHDITITFDGIWS